MNRRGLLKLLVVPFVSRLKPKSDIVRLTPDGPMILRKNMTIDIHDEEFHGSVDLRQHGPFDFATELRVRYVDARRETARNMHKMLTGWRP